MQRLEKAAFIIVFSLFTIVTLQLHDRINGHISQSDHFVVTVNPKAFDTSVETIDSKMHVREPRIYCMVPTHVGQLKLWKVILDGYGQYCDVLKFMIDPLTYKEEQKLFRSEPVKGIFFKNYPLKPELRHQSYEFDVHTELNNKAKVVVIGMKRRKHYLLPTDKNLLDSLFGSAIKYNKTFYDTHQYKDIGICADKKPCRHIWEKVWRSLVYIQEHDILSADFFLKVDDDTFLIPQMLKKFIKGNGLDANEELYFGHKAFSSPNFFISGVCSIFSRETVIKVSERFKSMKHEYGDRLKFSSSHGLCVDRDGATEERVTSRCLKDVGILPNLAAEIISDRFVLNNFSYYDSFLPDIDEFPSQLSDKERAELNQQFFDHLKADLSKEEVQQRVNYFRFDSDIKSLPKGSITADLIFPLGLPFTLTYKRKKTTTGWYWNEKSTKRGDMFNCCSYNAFAVHGYKSSSRMAEFDELVYKLTDSQIFRRYTSAKVGSPSWYYLYYIIKLRKNIRSYA